MRRLVIFALAALLLLGGCAQTSQTKDKNADLAPVNVESPTPTPVPTIDPTISPSPTPEPTPEPFYFLAAPWGSTKDYVLSVENGELVETESDPQRQPEYTTIAYKAREIYSVNTLTSYIFSKEDQLCAGQFISFTVLATQETRKAATQNYLNGLIEDYGDPIETDGISYAKWEVDTTTIELTVEDSFTSVYFCDTTRCSFTSRKELVEYNTSTLPAEEIKATQLPDIPIPLKIANVRLKQGVLGTPDLYVDVENISSDLAIDAYEFKARCYNNFDERVKGYGVYEYFNGIFQESTLKPGQKSRKDWHWGLYGFETATYVEVAITRVHTTDGTTWEVPEQDLIWVSSRDSD
jgi:hypothetical protein